MASGSMNFAMLAELHQWRLDCGCQLHPQPGSGYIAAQAPQAISSSFRALHVHSNPLSLPIAALNGNPAHA
jgi:hypothetical protein